MLLMLKNGAPADRARYERVQELFAEFIEGRRCEVRLMPAEPQPQGAGSEPGPPGSVPVIFVTVNAVSGRSRVVPEVPIEFAGAGAWEALVLASVLADDAASVVVLDEPAVALHPGLQRQLAAHLGEAKPQLLVITHSAELLPLSDAADLQLVRFDRDARSATRAWALDETCRVKMIRKLAAKGNERLPFSRRAVLCEGEDDVQAVRCLADKMGVNLRRLNISVADCGGRDNLPDYIWFCAQIGLPYLAVMDADAAKRDAQALAQAVRDAVKTRRGGVLFEFPENLETAFGVTKRPSVRGPRGGACSVSDARRRAGCEAMMLQVIAEFRRGPGG